MVEIFRQNKKENIKLYKKIYKELKDSISYKNIPISHVGSTAIPNMYGKNIIDILIGVENEEQMDKIAETLKNIGYYPGKKNTGYIYRFFANKIEETKAGDVHIHLVTINTQRYKDFIILKEYLLNNKEERKKYSDMKKSILKMGKEEREEYKTTKSIYVTNLLERARNWYNK